MVPSFKNILLASALSLGLGVAPTAFAGEALEITDFIGTINWSNGPMKVEVKENKGKTQIAGDNSVSIDGGFRRIDGSDCKSSYGRYSIDWFGKSKEGQTGGYKNLDNLPVLDIQIPDDTKLVIRNAVVFSLGNPDVAEADIELRNCGSVTLGDVAGTLAFDSRGSGDLDVGETGQIVVSLRGSGDLSGLDSGEVLIKSTGSGDIELGDIQGLESSSHGSGDLEIGNIDGNVDISSLGSGDIEIETITGSVNYTGKGSGDLEVTSVNGDFVKVYSFGSGGAEFGDGDVDELVAKVQGSGSIEFSGSAKTAILKTSGSGGVNVDRVSGDVEISATGSGDIEIADRS